MKQIIIYGLKDSKNGIIKYVGKTCNKLNYRVNQHIGKSKTAYNSPLFAWIRKVLNQNKQIIGEILEICDENVWEEREIFWIKKLNEITKLKNLSEGGITPLNSRIVKDKAYSNRKLKEVSKYTLEGVYIETYKSCAEAARLNFVNRRGIQKCLNGGLSAYGFYWSYNKIDKIEIRKPIKTGWEKGHEPYNKGQKLSEEHKNLLSDKKKKKVINIETGEIYESLKDAAISINIPYKTFVSQLFYNSTKSKFKYLEDKFNKPKINLKKRRVINIETNEIYESVVEACYKSGFSNSKMMSILKGKNKLKNYIYE
jgi:hypothetical protein